MPMLRYTSEPGSDRAINCADLVYATARAGNGTLSGTAINSDYDYNAVGQTRGGPGMSGNTFQVNEAGVRFVHGALPANTKLVSAWFSLHGNNFAGATLRDLEIRLHGGFGTGDVFTSDDFIAGNLLGDLNPLGTIRDINNSMAPFYPMCAGSDNLYARLTSTTAPINALVITNRQRIGNPPTGDERNGLYWGEYAFDWLRPALVKQTLTASALERVQGASAQLSDGTAVFVTISGSGEVELKYSTAADQSTDNPIGTLYVGTSTGQFDSTIVTRQAISLCVDDADNIWVVGKGGTGNNAVVGQAFLKGAGYTWTARTPREWDAPGYPGGPINNIAVAWHQTVNMGHLMVVTQRRAGTGHSTSHAEMTVSCNNLQAGAGSYVAASYTNPGTFGLNDSARNPGAMFINDLGTGLDLLGGFGNKGLILTFDGTMWFPASQFWPAPRVRIRRYTVNSSGQLGSTAGPSEGIPLNLHPDSRAKIVPIDADRVAIGYGDRISVYSWSGALSLLGTASLADVTMYDRPADWVYDAATNRIWAYYTVGRQLIRRGLSLSTYSFGPAVNVGAPVGATSDVITGIRAPRGRINERRVRIDVAVRSLTAEHSLIPLPDPGLNVAPYPPTLTPKADFSAANATTFAWEFADANTADAQTGYQLRVYDQAAPTTPVHDTGKVLTGVSSYTMPAGALSNDKVYNWEVRVWDLADGFSTYSAQDSFRTLSTAVTTITSPAEDNPADAVSSSYLVAWSTTVITQARYRLLLQRVQNNQTVLDTGFVTSTQTARQITGLEDGVEYRVTVWVRNNFDVESAPGERLITPVYTQPATPILIATIGDSYIQLTVNNPEPVADEPLVLSNDLWRTVTDAEEWARVANIPNSGEYRDYNVASGVSYQYYVEAQVS